MKSIEEVLENYDQYETDKYFDQRFSKRFIDFLTDEQIEANIEKVHYKFTGGFTRTVTPWTEEEVLKQLKEDVMFGWEKSQNHRGISSELMAYVVLAWNKVLENGMESLDYGWYGDNIFKTTAKYYGWELEV